MLRTLLPASLVVLALAAPAAADEAEGRRIAERACSGCHAVAGSALATDAAPSFESIAAKSKGTTAWLTAWLSAPHPAMPDLALTRREIADVTDYLKALAAR